VTEVKRLLVPAGAAVADVDELPPSVRALIDAAGEVFVVTPTLPSRLEWLMSDVDSAHQAADDRLETVLGHLRSAGVAARGAIGDDTPITVVADHVRAFEPDHILISLRSSDHADWQERGLVAEIERTVDLPITIFGIDAEGHVVSTDI
jgi:hypothetical protein